MVVLSEVTAIVDGDGDGGVLLVDGVNARRGQLSGSLAMRREAGVLRGKVRSVRLYINHTMNLNRRGR